MTDFREVECGCEGKTLGDGDSGGGAFGRLEIAATVLAVLAVLLILVCGTFCYTRRRKRTTTPWLEQGEHVLPCGFRTKGCIASYYPVTT